MGTQSHSIRHENNQYHLMKINLTELKMTNVTAGVGKTDLPAIKSHPRYIRTSYKKFKTNGIKMPDHERSKPQR